MRRCTVGLVFVVALATFASPLGADAQPPTKVPRVGLLRTGSPPDPFVESFRQALRDLGYLEGQNIVIEYRWAEGRVDRFPELAADLVRLNVDVIVAGGFPATRAAKQATTSIPIVMSATTDPVASGFIASLARPGGNITGSATLLSELAAKRLELLKEVLPKVSRVAVLYDPAGDPIQLRESQAAARRLKVRLQVLEARVPEDLEGALKGARKGRAAALSVLASAFLSSQRARIVDLAAKDRLPAIYEHREFVETGGLISYGPNFRDLFRRAAAYMDKILKGAKPADLPVEQPTRFELVINLKTAKALGLTFPPSVLVRADQVIQ